MSDRNITVTLKAGEGFSAPWVVIGGDRLEEINHQLDQILAAGTLQKAAAVAIAFHNGYRDLRHTSENAQEPPPQQPPVQQQPPQQNYQAGPPSQTSAWASQPPPQQDPWANQGPPPQWATGAPQGQQQGYQQQSQPQGGAPGGAPVCKCGQVMEYKTTGNNKPVWRCKDWRWNNGNPTPNHDQIWVEGH